MKIWIAESVNDGRREIRKTLKALCVVIGVAYGTAKRVQDKEGGKTVYKTGWVVSKVEVE